MNNLLYRLTTNLPMRLIDLDLKPYLERYHLAALGGCRAWLHHFVSADADRNVHDHPWPAISIILTGGYRELVERADGSMDIVDHNAPSINFIPAHKRHRIIQMKPGTWSLMLVGRRHGRGWTVYNNDGTSSHEPDEGRNLEWQKTAGNRAAAYRVLRVMRQEAGLEPHEGWNCRCQAIPVRADDADGHRVDALKHMVSVGYPARNVGKVWTRHRLNAMAHTGFDPASADEVIEDEAFYYVNAEQAAERHDISYAAVVHGRRMISQFEWLTRCQRELARQTNNWFGDWGPNALECYRNYWPFMSAAPERAADRYLNDEFTNGR